MLALFSGPLSKGIRCCSHPHRYWTPRRGFIDTAQPFSEAFIALANSLPLPIGWPAYATTIILGTTVAKTTVSLPFVLWSRRRARRLETFVQPELSKEASLLRERLSKEILRHGGTREAFKAAMSTEMTAKRKGLMKKHGTSPLATIVLPAVVNVPLFLALTLWLRAAATPPTPLVSESFLTFGSLASVDATGVMPIAVGLITLANIELGRPGPATIHPKRLEMKNLRSLLWTNRRIFLTFGMRSLAIVAIPVALNMPGAVVLYWFTSGLYTLCERSIFGLIDRQRERKAKSQAENIVEARKKAFASRATGPAMAWSPRRDDLRTVTPTTSSSTLTQEPPVEQILEHTNSDGIPTSKTKPILCGPQSKSGP